MTKKSHAINVAVILGISAVLMLFIFILVAHHHNIPERIRQHRSALLPTGLSVAEWIKPAGQVRVLSGETQWEPVKAAVTAPPSGRDA